MKQLSLGWQLYTSENAEHFPFNCAQGGPDVPGESTAAPSWVAGKLRTNSTPDNTNIALLLGAAYVRFGSIGSYVQNPLVYHCPADVSMDPGNYNPRVRSVSMNGWINPVKINMSGTYWPEPFQKFTQSADFVRASPANIFVFVDERPETINDAGFGFLSAATSGLITSRETSKSIGAIVQKRKNTQNFAFWYDNSHFGS